MMDALPSDEIVIVASRLPDSPAERAYAAVTLPSSVMSDAGRLDEALQTIPGVSLFRRNNSITANPTVQGLTIRSIAPSGAGRTLVTLDGLPLNDPFGGWVIWGSVPTELIDTVRIVRGAGTGPYGAGALSGAVLLQEMQQAPERLTAELAEQGGGRMAFIGDAESGPISYMLTGQSEHGEGWVPVRAGRGIADQQLESESRAGMARIQWQADGRVFSARLGGYGESRSAGLIGADSANTGTSLSLVLAEPGREFGWRGQLWGVRSNLSNRSVTVAADRSITTPANDQYATPSLGVGGNGALRWTHADRGLELGMDARFATGESREWFRYQGSGFTRSRIAGGKTLVTGGYGEGWYEPNRWLITAGARLDYWRAFDGERTERDLATQALVLNTRAENHSTVAPTARFGVQRLLGEHFGIRSAAYTGFRPPTLNELHRPFRVGNDVTEANPALEPERLTGFDAALFGSSLRWSWSAGIFATRLENAITNVTVGNGPGTFPPGVFVPSGGVFRQRRNAGEIRGTGIETDARGMIDDVWQWRSAVNWTRARIDNLRPAQSPTWSATAGLAWRGRPRITTTMDIRYESARYDDDLNSRLLTAMFLLDMRAEYALADWVSISAAVDNVTDAAVETAETADGIESYGAPRTLRIGVRMRAR